MCDGVLGGEYGHQELCKNPAIYRISEGIARGCLICRECVDRLHFPVSYLEPLQEKGVQR